MQHTFLFAVEEKNTNTIIKFESSSEFTLEFLVTFLNGPRVSPFIIKKEAKNWQLPSELPAEVLHYKAEILNAARHFQR